MAPPDRLSQDELAVVLRRAAQLDTTTMAIPDSGLSIEAVEAAAAEVGLAPEAVRQAVAELRAGLLGGDDDERIGDDIVVAARVVPLDVDAALAAADRFLAGKVFERVRDRATARSYRRRDDTLAKLTKAFDFGGGSKKLKQVAEVQVTAVAVAEGTLLRVVARMNRGLALAPRIAGTSVGVAMGALATVGFAASTDGLWLAAGPPIGAGSGVVSYRLGRAVLWRERKRVSEVVEGFLDDLELGRQLEPSRMDKLRRYAPKLRGPWV